MALIVSDKIFLQDKKESDRLRQRGFGEQKNRELVLDLFEGFYLMQKDKLGIEDSKGKNLSEEEFLKKASAKIKDFYVKYQVFFDMRERGYIVKTGFKFGFDFRVYPRGKKPGEAHSQWCINVSAQNDKYNYIEMSRMVRLAGNLKTKFLDAVVDSENEINYYETERITP